MRSAVIFVLFGLGAFAVATGLVLQQYSYPTLAKVSHDIDSTSVSRGDGITALVLAPNGSSVTPEIRHNLSISATTRVLGDLAQPEVKEGGEVTVWRRSTIVKEDKDNLTLSAEVRRICLNRQTGESVAPCLGQYYETEQGKRKTAEGEELLQPGLNFVFPFDTQRKDYLWYDTVLEKPLFIRFDGTDTVKGLDVYRFVQVVPPTPVGKISVPGNMIGRSEPSVEVTQYYEVNRTLTVEPVTGAVLSARDDVRQELRAADQNAGEGTPVFDGVLSLDDESVQANVDQVKNNQTMLFAITTLPAVLLISGAVLLALALLVLVLGRRRFGAGTLIGVIIAVLVCAGVASGATYTVTNVSNPDTELDLRGAVQNGRLDGTVDYGVR